MRGRSAGGGVRTSGCKQHDRLPGIGERTCGGDESTTVDDVLGVDRDARGAVVGHAGLHQVDHGQIGLVAERHEPRDAETHLAHAVVEIDDHVAALAQHRHVTRRQHLAAQLQARRQVLDAGAVRSDHDRPGGAYPADRLGLHRGALGAQLAQSGGDRDQCAYAGGERVVDRGEEAGGRNAQRHQVDAGVGSELAQAAYGGPAEHRATPAVDQVHGPVARSRQRALGQRIPPLGVVVTGADDGDRAGVEQRTQVPAGARQRRVHARSVAALRLTRHGGHPTVRLTE